MVVNDLNNGFVILLMYVQKYLSKKAIIKERIIQIFNRNFLTTKVTIIMKVEVQPGCPVIAQKTLNTRKMLIYVGNANCSY